MERHAKSVTHRVNDVLLPDQQAVDPVLKDTSLSQVVQISENVLIQLALTDIIKTHSMMRVWHVIYHVLNVQAKPIIALNALQHLAER